MITFSLKELIVFFLWSLILLSSSYLFYFYLSISSFILWSFLSSSSSFFSSIATSVSSSICTSLSAFKSSFSLILSSSSLYFKLDCTISETSIVLYYNLSNTYLSSFCCRSYSSKCLVSSSKCFFYSTRFYACCFSFSIKSDLCISSSFYLSF